jgi:hypothetical protein
MYSDHAGSSGLIFEVDTTVCSFSAAPDGHSNSPTYIVSLIGLDGDGQVPSAAATVFGAKMTSFSVLVWRPGWTAHRLASSLKGAFENQQLSWLGFGADKDGQIVVSGGPFGGKTRKGMTGWKAVGAHNLFAAVQAYHEVEAAETSGPAEVGSAGAAGTATATAAPMLVTSVCADEPVFAHGGHSYLGFSFSPDILSFNVYVSLTTYAGEVAARTKDFAASISAKAATAAEAAKEALNERVAHVEQQEKAEEVAKQLAKRGTMSKKRMAQQERGRVHDKKLPKDESRRQKKEAFDDLFKEAGMRESTRRRKGGKSTEGKITAHPWITTIPGANEDKPKKDYYAAPTTRPTSAGERQEAHAEFDLNKENSLWSSLFKQNKNSKATQPLQHQAQQQQQQQQPQNQWEHQKTQEQGTSGGGSGPTPWDTMFGGQSKGAGVKQGAEKHTGVKQGAGKHTQGGNQGGDPLDMDFVVEAVQEAVEGEGQEQAGRLAEYGEERGLVIVWLVSQRGSAEAGGVWFRQSPANQFAAPSVSRATVWQQVGRCIATTVAFPTTLPAVPSLILSLALTKSQAPPTFVGANVAQRVGMAGFVVLLSPPSQSYRSDRHCNVDHVAAPMKQVADGSGVGLSAEAANAQQWRVNYISTLVLYCEMSGWSVWAKSTGGGTGGAAAAARQKSVRVHKQRQQRSRSVIVAPFNGPPCPHRRVQWRAIVGLQTPAASSEGRYKSERSVAPAVNAAKMVRALASRVAAGEVHTQGSRRLFHGSILAAVLMLVVGFAAQATTLPSKTDVRPTAPTAPTAPAPAPAPLPAVAATASYQQRDGDGRVHPNTQLGGYGGAAGARLGAGYGGGGSGYGAYQGADGMGFSDGDHVDGDYGDAGPGLFVA